jgi:hypothetical protein
LEGGKSAEPPFEQSTKVGLVINIKVAARDVRFWRLADMR